MRPRWPTTFASTPGYIVTGWSGLHPDRQRPAAARARGAGVGGPGPDSRLYPRSRNVFIGWGTSLYMLGVALASIVGSAVG